MGKLDTLLPTTRPSKPVDDDDFHRPSAYTTSQRLRYRRRQILRIIFIIGLVVCGLYIFSLSETGNSLFYQQKGEKPKSKNWFQQMSDEGRNALDSFLGKYMDRSKPVAPPITVTVPDKTPIKPAVTKQPVETLPHIAPVPLSQNPMVQMVRTMVQMGSDSMIQSFVPILSVLFPKDMLIEIERSMIQVEKGEISNIDAFKNSILPVSKAFMLSILAVFPRIGEDILDTGSSFFEVTTDWINGFGDPSLMMKYFTDFLSSMIVPLMGLSESYHTQTSLLLKNALVQLLAKDQAASNGQLQFAESSEEEASIFSAINLLELQNIDKQWPSWAPSWQKLTDVGFSLAKDLASLKAQQTLVDSFKSYVSNADQPKLPSTGNPMADMALNAFAGFLTPKQKEELVSSEEIHESSVSKHPEQSHTDKHAHLDKDIHQNENKEPVVEPPQLRKPIEKPIRQPRARRQ